MQAEDENQQNEYLQKPVFNKYRTEQKLSQYFRVQFLSGILNFIDVFIIDYVSKELLREFLPELVRQLSPEIVIIPNEARMLSQYQKLSSGVSIFRPI